MVKDEQMSKKSFLLKEIAKLFCEKGFEGTSIRDISKALGMSNAGLYYHFRDKQEMLFAITSQLIDEAIEDLKKSLPKIKEAEDQIYWIVESHIMFYKNHRFETKVLIHERYTLQGEYAQLMHKKETEYVALLKETIKGIMNEGFTENDITVATYSLLGMLNWIIHWYDPEGPISPEQLAKGITTIFLRGVKNSGKWKETD